MHAMPQPMRCLGTRHPSCAIGIGTAFQSFSCTCHLGTDLSTTLLVRQLFFGESRATTVLSLLSIYECFSCRPLPPYSPRKTSVFICPNHWSCSLGPISVFLGKVCCVLASWMVTWTAVSSALLLCVYLQACCRHASISVAHSHLELEHSSDLHQGWLSISIISSLLNHS